MKICESQTLFWSHQFKLGRTKLIFCPLKFPWGPNTLGPLWIFFLSPQIQFININAGHANSVVAEMVYLCTNFVVDPICCDLRAFGGTSLDHKFLVGGPKSIYRAGAGIPLFCKKVLVGNFRLRNTSYRTRPVWAQVKWFPLHYRLRSIKRGEMLLSLSNSLIFAWISLVKLGKNCKNTFQIAFSPWRGRIWKKKHFETFFSNLSILSSCKNFRFHIPPLHVSLNMTYFC